MLTQQFGPRGTHLLGCFAVYRMSLCFLDKNGYAHECLLATCVKASMACWHGKGYPYMLKPCLCCLSGCLLPSLYTFCLCASPSPSPLPCPYTSSFSRLFSSSGATAKKPAAVEAPVNVKYNAPTAQIQPSIKKKSSALQQLPSDKSKAFDFLNEE